MFLAGREYTLRNRRPARARGPGGPARVLLAAGRGGSLEGSGPAEVGLIAARGVLIFAGVANRRTTEMANRWISD